MIVKFFDIEIYIYISKIAKNSIFLLKEYQKFGGLEEFLTFKTTYSFKMVRVNFSYYRIIYIKY